MLQWQRLMDYSQDGDQSRRNGKLIARLDFAGGCDSAEKFRRGRFVADTRLGCPVVRVVVRWCSGCAHSWADLLAFFGVTIILI